jgi:hypothetical protein
MYTTRAVRTTTQIGIATASAIHKEPVIEFELEFGSAFPTTRLLGVAAVPVSAAVALVYIRVEALSASVAGGVAA